MTVGQYKSESDPRGYTPTTEDVRDEWRYNIQEVDMDGNVVVSFDEAGAQFDRWLAEHDAKVRAEALREAAQEMDEIEAKAEIAEFAAYVEGETSRQSVIDAATEMQKDPAQWVRTRADRVEREAGQS